MDLEAINPADKFQPEVQQTTPKPANLFQIVQLAEKLGRSHSTSFEVMRFRRQVQRVVKSQSSSFKRMK